MSKIISLDLTLEPADNTRLANLCGPFDDNIKQLERRLGVEISHRHNTFTVMGKPHTANAAVDILKRYMSTRPPYAAALPTLNPKPFIWRSKSQAS